MNNETVNDLPDLDPDGELEKMDKYYAELHGEGETEDLTDESIEEVQTVRQFLTKLENFLEETLDDESTRGNVFIAENGDGVSMNIVVGAAFADNLDGEEVNQINISILPTDRSVLGSDGVSMSNDDAEFEDEDYDEDDLERIVPF